MAEILVVDDEANIRRMLARLLEAEGHRVREAADGAGAFEAVAAAEPEVVLLDLALPGADGIAVLETLRERHPDLPIVMMSGRATLSDAVRATKLGAFHFLEKPLSPEAVLLALQGAIELRRARELSRTLAAELGTGDRLVGSSPAMQRVRELIQRAAPTDARVLITGESGTGKELAAAALHALSPRAAGPFIRVNSAAIPRDLIESEMFGHEKGAFTGATERRRGRFELAHGGTLFLDEVAELRPEAQAKLLRVIESGEIERVGGQEPIPVDVRIIAATNRDLREEMAAGRFRDDLFFRLNVVPIHMPPLRERPEDIPELAAHFMARLRVRHGLTPPVLLPEALELMQGYAWPGNVRELANICERLAILFPGGAVGARELEQVLPEAAASRNVRAAAWDGPDASEPMDLSSRIDAFERRLILEALEAANGSVAEAARRLRTDRPNLYRRMKRLGIER
ncbi:MAG: sigma-54 dependent transcriptional regulator [bacterium]|jgi:two-component system nitrogen regulation response regulator NtrX|nr:MAG: Fis family transcriptional regulator [bacterium]